MRRLTLLVLIALVVPLACKKPDAAGDAGADGAASASASASAAPSDSSSATPTATAVVHYGPAAAGTPCRPGADTNACAADKLEELTCTAGVWRVMQSCRGPGGCTGTGAAAACDLGTPVVGDPCVVNTSNFQCIRRQVLHSCVAGKWTESLCTPPQFCHPVGPGSPVAGCRL